MSFWLPGQSTWLTSLGRRGLLMSNTANPL